MTSDPHNTQAEVIKLRIPPSVVTLAQVWVKGKVKEGRGKVEMEEGERRNEGGGERKVERKEILREVREKRKEESGFYL